MKITSIFYLFLFPLLLFVACGNREDIPTTTDKGNIQIDLSLDLSYPNSNEIQIRALDLAPYKDLTNYTVELMDKQGNILQKKPYKEMDLAQEIAPGSYKIRAYYGENVDAAYEKLYVEGSQDFSVGNAETKKVSFVGTPANVRVKVQYSEDFFIHYFDCAVEFKTQYLTSPFRMEKEDVDKDLYLKAAAEGESLTISFDLIGEEGPITPDNFAPQTIQIKPRDFLTITVSPNVTDIDAGTLSGITVTIDTGVMVENIDITLPDDYMPGEDTVINN